MKVIGLSGSMRQDGNTAMLVRTILKRCSDAGIPTEYITLAGKEIRPCIGCEECAQKHWCAITNDDWEDVAQKIADCSVLVIGTPTYYYDVSGQLKNFIDRTYSLYHDRRLAGKGAVAVAVQASTGAERALQTIEGFLSAHGFSSLASIAGTGTGPGDVANDKKAMRAAEKAGDAIVRLLRPTPDRD